MKKRMPLLLILIYVICFIAVMALWNDKSLQIKLILLITSMMFLIFLIMLKFTGKLYWLTSFDYDDYNTMSSIERLDISSAYAKIMSLPNSVFCIYQFISIYFHISIIVDVLAFIFCLLWMCLQDIKYKRN